METGSDTLGAIDVDTIQEQHADLSATWHEILGAHVLSLTRQQDNICG
jgi:hypothetical protein